MSTGADPKTMPVTAAYEAGHAAAFGERVRTETVERRVYVMRCSACDGVQHPEGASLKFCDRCKGWTVASVDASLAPPPKIDAALNAPILSGRFYENSISPVDGSDIGSRRRYEEHNKRHGVTNASDYTKTHARAAAEREKQRQSALSGKATGRDSAARREQLGRALYQARKP